MTNHICNFVLTVLLSIQRKRNLSLFTKRKIFHFSCLIEHIQNWLSMRLKNWRWDSYESHLFLSIRDVCRPPTCCSLQHHVVITVGVRLKKRNRRPPTCCSLQHLVVNTVGVRLINWRISIKKTFSESTVALPLAVHCSITLLPQWECD